MSVFLCAHASWRLVFLPTLTPAVRRFWRVLAVAITLECVGAVTNIRDALGVPDAPSQRLSPVTLTLYMTAVFAVQWGLLRLPTGTGQRMRWPQFLLDSGTVTVMAAVFGWHFSFRNSEQWIRLSGSVWAPLIVIVLGFTLIVTVMKLATSGVGALDRGVLRLLALALGTSSLAGAAAPFFIGHPYITDAHLSVPTAAVCILFAARRQEQAAGLPPPPPVPVRRGVNLVPYAAAAAVNVLLLVEGRGEDGAVIVAATVAVTSIVVARQIVAFRDNQRLLKAIDETVLDLSAARDQLANQASHDDLTGLGNRRLLHEKVDEALASLPPPSVHLALIDLDDFKMVNDRLGHLVGDALLRAVADRLDQVAGPGATLVRLGGDEFALLLAPMAPDTADAAVARIAESLQTPLRVAGDDLVMHASIGLANADLTGTLAGTSPVDARELLRRADVAMYTAKDRGKDRYARYEPAMDRDAAEDAALTAQLRQAVDRAELYLVYQPIIRLVDGAIVGAEALVRWSHPERGLVPPNVFIPVAERSGLIIPLGDWILREACRQAAAGRRGGLGEGLGQRLRPAAARARVRHAGGERPRRDRAGSEPAHHRGHRDRRVRRWRRFGLGTGVAHTRPDHRARRLRHRALVAGPAAHMPGRRAQGGQELRRLGRHRQRPDRHRDLADPDRRRAAPAGGRRGRRDRRAGSRVAPARVPLRAGLLLRPPDAGA